MNTIQRQINTPYVVAWNKLYRRAVFETLRYPAGRRNEDVFVFAELFDTVKTVACLPERLYFYRQREGSIMSSAMTLRNLDEMWAFEACYDYFAAHGLEELMPHAEKRMFAKLTGVYRHLPKALRHSGAVKQARKAQMDAALRLARLGRLTVKTMARTLLFQLAPDIYAWRYRWKPKKRARKSASSCRFTG